MAQRIEDYGLIGDCHTAALVGRDGSIDWLCLPRFDSAACFAALLGTEENGRWLIAPAVESRVERRYRPGTLILETTYTTADAEAVVVDFMPPRTQVPDLARIVKGVRGRMPFRMEFVLRFDYGQTVPWVRRSSTGITAVAGPERVDLQSPVPVRGRNFRTCAEFEAVEGRTLPFVLVWSLSYRPPPDRVDAVQALDQTESFWEQWSGRCRTDGAWNDAVRRSLITLKALTYAPTGGIVAAPTTSLPAQLGGERNWDYRYCWLRDATFTLFALLKAGYHDEAKAWREWLLRAVAGKPEQLHILYGIAGERRIAEAELPWLPGYEGASPVRVGNLAYTQRQLDVFGEVMDVMLLAWKSGMEPGDPGWRLEKSLLSYLTSSWREPDEGIWEVRGPRRHFTHSKIMAWVAFDRAVKTVEQFRLDGPVARWRAMRDEIHAEVCRRGFDASRNTFVQAYDVDHLDASLLTIPLVGFLPPEDPRVIGTVEAVQRELVRDGFVQRYRTMPEIDGLPSGEGAFLLCTFWLADALEMIGRHDEAHRTFERVLAIRNDLGLLAEGYDVQARRMVGNFPQAFSHVGLANTARNLSHHESPAEERAAGT